MTVFLSIAALLTLLVIGMLVRPLIWSKARADVSPQRLNASIYRDQLEALEREHANKELSTAEYEGARDELQLRLLDDEQDGTPAPQQPFFWSASRTAWAIALMVPLASAGMYAWLGTPKAIDPASAQKADQDEINKMVDGLAARLKANPDNPKGWAMLGRSYKVMGRLQEAEEAYARVGAMMDTDPDLLTSYADLLAARAGDKLEGKPMELIGKALALNPAHPMGLMLAGTAAYRQGNFVAAVDFWERLQAVVEPGSPDAEQLQADIADARAKAGMTAPPAGKAVASAGKAQAMDPAAAAQGAANNPMVLQMVDRLATRLKGNPNDPAGWAKLGRAYKVLGRLNEAEAAYGKAGKFIEADPDMLTDYADMLATRAGNNLDGRPLELINKALVLNPRHAMALMLSGTAAYRKGDFALAVTQWEKLTPLFEPGTRDAEWVKSSLADARSKGALAAAVKK